MRWTSALARGRVAADVVPPPSGVPAPVLLADEPGFRFAVASGKWLPIATPRHIEATLARAGKRRFRWKPSTRSVWWKPDVSERRLAKNVLKIARPIFPAAISPKGLEFLRGEGGQQGGPFFQNQPTGRLNRINRPVG